jgi:hypothetical protein
MCVAAALSATACKKTTGSPEPSSASTDSVGSAGTSTTGAGATGAAGANVPVQGAGGSTCLNCEMKATNVDKTCFNDSSTGNVGTTDPKKFGCSGFSASDQAKCNAVLSCIRSSHCGKGDDATPCLCGTLTISACAAQPVTALPGPCRDLYIAAANGGNVYTLFFSTDSPMGIANNLYTCDVDAHCACP